MAILLRLHQSWIEYFMFVRRCFLRTIYLAKMKNDIKTDQRHDLYCKRCLEEYDETTYLMSGFSAFLQFKFFTINWNLVYVNFETPCVISTEPKCIFHVNFDPLAFQRCPRTRYFWLRIAQTRYIFLGLFPDPKTCF